MNQIMSFINAMVIDYAHAATGNRVKWTFTSDTRADVVEMAVAVYRKNARRPYFVIFPQYNAIRNEINTVAAPIIEGDAAASIKGDYMRQFETVNAFQVFGSPYDNDSNPIYTPAQQPAEAPQTAEQEQTEEQPTEATETAKKHAHATPAKLAKEYTARTHTNRSRLQRPRLPGWGSLCNSISWRCYHTAQGIPADIRV